MENLIFTQLTIPEIQKLFYNSLENYFDNKKDVQNDIHEKPVTKMELADYFGISPPTVTRLEKRNIIPSIRIGGVIRFKISAVVTALEKYQANRRKYLPTKVPVKIEAKTENSCDNKKRRSVKTPREKYKDKQNNF